MGHRSVTWLVGWTAKPARSDVSYRLARAIVAAMSAFRITSSDESDPHDSGQTTAGDARRSGPSTGTRSSSYPHARNRRLWHRRPCVAWRATGSTADCSGTRTGRGNRDVGSRCSIREGRRSCRQRSLERRAIHVLHDQIVGADVVESADVGMVQCRHGTSFPVETFGELLFGNLDSDGAVQSLVTGFKTSPIPPAPRGATIS